MTTLHVPNVTRLAGYAQIAVGLAVVLAIVYAVRKLQQGAGAVANAIAEPAAELYLNLTHDAAEVLGAVRLPSGQYITFNEIVEAGSKLGSDNRFTWQGQRYEVSREGSGYKAVRV